MKVRPYILAGGRSSRMGSDKAMLELGGRSLLGHAVDSLKALPSLRNNAGEVLVTVVGERSELEGADRVICDRYVGCGPLGGMEAALRDLIRTGHDPITRVEWAFFFPVDMPFLPVGLINALLTGWIEAARRGSKICSLEVDGRPQPLICMMHTSFHPFLEQALTAGQFKVTAVLQSAADVLASRHSHGIRFRKVMTCKTPVALEETMSGVAGWRATEAQERLKPFWFANLNNEAEFRRAETFALSSGLNG